MRRSGWLSQQVASSARVATPKEHRPCRMGLSKPAFLAASRIGVDRVVVAGEAIDQRRLRQYRQRAFRIRGALGNGVDRRSLGNGAAAAAVTAQHIGGGDGADQLAAVLLAQQLLEIQHGALAFALVQHAGDTVGTDVGLAGFQRPVHADALFAVQQLEPGDFQLRLLDPGARVAQHVGHGGEHLQALLVGELQFGRIGLVAAEADAEGIQHAIARRGDLFEGGELLGEEFFEIHGLSLGLIAMEARAGMRAVRAEARTAGKGA